MGLADPRLPVRGRAVRPGRPSSRPAPTSRGRPLLRRRTPRRRGGRRWGRARTSWSPTSAGPLRFHHMLRVAKPTSPMSVGTWIIAAYSPGIGLAAASELLPARWRATPVGRLLAGWPGPRRCRRPRSRPRWRPTPRCCCRRPPCPRGTPRTRTCRSCSPARPRRARAGWGWCSCRPRRPARRARSRRSARRPSSWRRGCMEHRLGLVGEAYTTGTAHRLRQLVGVPDRGRARRAPCRPGAAALAAVASGLALMAGQRAAAVRRVRGRRRVDPGPALRRHAAARTAGGGGGPDAAVTGGPHPAVAGGPHPAVPRRDEDPTRR